MTTLDYKHIDVIALDSCGNLSIIQAISYNFQGNITIWMSPKCYVKTRENQLNLDPRYDFDIGACVSIYIFISILRALWRLRVHCLCWILSFFSKTSFLCFPFSLVI